MEKGIKKSGSHLIDCLEKKWDILRDFLRITESLKNKADLQDMPGVMRLLDQRQDCIHTVNRIDDQLLKIRSENPPNEEEIPEEFKERIGSVSQNIKKILQEVRTLDQGCLDRITSLRDEIKVELLKVHQSLRATHSYAEKSMGQPKFLDVIR